MIDPRFAAASGIPLAPGYGAQAVPTQYHHHRHHRHHKHKARNDVSPISLDESIHKVEHGHRHHHFQQNDGAQLSGGYGVPYGAAGYHHLQQQQQQQYPGHNYGYTNQYQNPGYAQASFGAVPGGQTIKRRRRHHRHHRHHTADEATTGSTGEHEQAVPEQLIGQRSSSVLGDEDQPIRSPAPTNDEKASEGQIVHRRHRRHHHRHHHHQNNQEEQASYGYAQQSQARHGYSNNPVGTDGYGHINEDLIFIERGDHSPHRQEPPPGYEYKGKIEVQGINKEYQSASRGAGLNIPQPPPPMPVHQPIPPPASMGPCPAGWQQMILSPAPGGPCPTGGLPYTGQLLGPASAASAYGTYGSSNPYSSQCQIVADYIFGANSAGSACGYQQASAAAGCVEQYQNQQALEHCTARPTIIEVWQKRTKSETHERSRSRSHHRSRTPAEGPGFDFDRFRDEILAAIERMVPRGGAAPDIQWVGRDGGTQTQIHPGETKVEERRPTASGEVRVIVQPIQPVFYMPRQGGAGTPTPGPGPAAPASGGAPNVVYVPRNVYVPVIKPVFVPRERVIVRPQVIHVARPVLVDRPVPVTQRPIIIDREKPIPVPVREGQAAVQGGGSKVVREEYVYRDNIPVAYGGRCAEFAGGVNYGYMPTQQEHQYAASSTHEASNIYQTQGAGVNVNVPNEYQHSHSSSHVETQQGCEGSFNNSFSNLAGQQVQQYATSSTHEVTGGGGSSFHGSYSNLSGVNAAPAANVGQLNHEVLRQTFEQSSQIAGVPPHCPTQIEVLDTAVNPFWQKTDQPTLMRRYGRPAFEIVHKSEEVEQQMYSELRQRESNASVLRSASAASYGSGSGIAVNGNGIAQY